MYVLFDLEWVTAEDGTPAMTQLAALRTDGAWQSQETTLSAKPALSVREQNARWVQTSPYNYIYLKNSPVFHRRECRLVLNSKELLGSVHYRTAAKGRCPCPRRKRSPRHLPRPAVDRFETGCLAVPAEAEARRSRMRDHAPAGRTDRGQSPRRH